MPSYSPNDPNHPIWGFFKFTLALIALTLLLWGEASNFDETEIRVITQFAALWAGGAGAGWGIKRIISQSKGEPK
jgi:hypothetical protein